MTRVRLFWILFSLSLSLREGSISFSSGNKSSIPSPPLCGLKVQTSADGIFPPCNPPNPGRHGLNSQPACQYWSNNFGRECYIFKFCKKTETDPTKRCRAPDLSSWIAYILLFPLSSVCLFDFTKMYIVNTLMNRMNVVRARG